MSITFGHTYGTTLPRPRLGLGVLLAGGILALAAIIGGIAWQLYGSGNGGVATAPASVRPIMPVEPVLVYLVTNQAQADLIARNQQFAAQERDQAGYAPWGQTVIVVAGDPDVYDLVQEDLYAALLGNFGRVDVRIIDYTGR